MPTIAGIDSFQHRSIPGNLTATANFWYTALNNGGTPPNHGGGLVTFDTSVKRTAAHACSLKIVSDNVTPANIRRTISSTMVVGSMYFLIPSLPASGSPKILAMGLSTGVASIQVDASTGALQTKVGSGTQVQGATNCVDNAWHRLDWKLDTTTGTAKLDVQLDGAAMTQATLALASAPITTIVSGDNTAAIAMTAYFSDLVWSVTSADYPIGDHICKLLAIDGEGTHSQSTGAFQTDTGATSGYGAAVDDVWDGTTPELSQTGEDHVKQTAVAAAGYLEFTTADPAAGDTTIWGAQLGVLMAALDSATANNCECRLVDSAGTTLATTGLTDPSINLAYYTGYRVITTAAPSGGWSNSSLAGCKIRWGYSTDVSPVPVMNTAMVEYVALWSASQAANITTTTVVGTATTFGPTEAAASALTTTTVVGTASVFTPTVVAKAGPTAGNVVGTASTFAPTVFGKANLTAGNVVSTGSVFTPTVTTAQPANVTAGNVVGTASTFTPTVAAQAILTAGNVISTASTFTPTAVAAANVTAGNVVATATVFTPTVTAVRTVAITTTTVIGTAATWAPAVVGNSNAPPSTVVSLATTFAPTVSAKANVTAGNVVGTATVFTPTVVAVGSANVTPTTVVGTATVFTPTVVAGVSVSVTAGNVVSTASTFTPTVAAGSALTAGNIVRTSSVFSPTVGTGVGVTTTTVIGTATIPTPTVVGRGQDASVTFLDPPLNLTATTISTSQIDLDWDAVTGAATYMVMRNGVVVQTGVVPTNWSDTGLTSNTTYTYRVKAVA